ncbi:MAG TPA: DNA polymerase III subunit delta [Desulfomicrobiaceae bacterium]|nr:DNA polymerase III subunit delta [Desulfomicrobiaceae bacterium]
MSRPGFTFCISPDPELIRDHITTLLDRHVTGPRQTVTFWGDEELPNAFWQSLAVPDLMGQFRAVILRRAQGLDVAFWNQLARELKGARRTIWPFFCLEGEWQRKGPSLPKTLTKQKYWTVAQKQQWVWQSPGLTASSMPSFLQKWATERGLVFERGVQQHLATGLPRGSFAVKNELRKLELLLGERTTVTTADLTIFAGRMDMDIFSFLSAIQSPGKGLEAWRKVLCDPLVSSEDLLFPFLGLLLRETRILWQLAAGEGDKVSLYPSLKQQKQQFAGRLGLARLARIPDLALDAETSVKTGRKGADQAMEFMVQELITLFRAA